MSPRSPARLPSMRTGICRWPVPATCGTLAAIRLPAADRPAGGPCCAPIRSTACPTGSQAALLGPGIAPGHRPPLAVRDWTSRPASSRTSDGCATPRSRCWPMTRRRTSALRACTGTSSMRVRRSSWRSSGRSSPLEAPRRSSAAPPARTGRAWPSPSSWMSVGVPREVIVEDYALSAADVRTAHGRSPHHRLARRLHRGRQPAGVHGVVPRAPRQHHGGAAAFLHANGVTADELRALMDLLTEPASS